MNSFYKNQWSSEGYCAIPDFFNNDYINNIIGKINNINFPVTGEFGYINFPSNYHYLNEISLHPDIIKACEVLLESNDIRLIQSEVWSKSSENSILKNGKLKPDSNSDQRMHMDYPNNYLTYPGKWGNPESVAIIIYYSDSNECNGQTAIVPRHDDDDIAYQHPYDKISGINKYVWFNDKETCEDYFKRNYPNDWKFRKILYDREIKVPYKRGTVLFYRHDLWHRGTPVLENQKRVVHNLGFKKSGCDYITVWNSGWAKSLCFNKDNLELLLSKLTNEQRRCLGIPDESSDYWNNEMILNVRQRYSKFGILLNSKL